MKPLADIGTDLNRPAAVEAAAAVAEQYLQLGEVVLEHWITARGLEPTSREKEGFRLLALHSQGARGEASFNACRETCRELVYHRNLILEDSTNPQVGKRLEMMRLVAMHLYLFVSGKMQVDQLGEFCCASKPVRLAAQG